MRRVCGRVVCVGVLVAVWVQQTARRLGRAVLADLVGGGLVGLAGAGFARHGENVNVPRPCFDGVNDRPLVGGVVGECCDAVPFCFALFCCFCDAF